MVKPQAKNGDGFSFKLQNQYYIFFNDSVPYLGRIPFTLAYEIGHILLGHVETITFYRNCEIDSQTMEKETIFLQEIFQCQLLFFPPLMFIQTKRLPNFAISACNHPKSGQNDWKSCTKGTVFSFIL